MSAPNMNVPEPFESFILEEGELKITIEHESKILNAATFIINKEDHTIGNMLRDQLLKDPSVIFAGYLVPHPMEHKIVLRIRTNGDSSPKEVLLSALSDLVAELSLFEERFKKAVRKAKEFGYIAVKPQK